MAIDNNPKRTATRRSKQQRRLPPDATCTCGENDPAVLELHHPTGREHDKNLTIVACKNCHAKQTEGQLEGEVPLGATDNWFDRGAAIVSALAAFFRFLADSLDRLAGHIKADVARLDEKIPEWRAELDEGN